MIDHKKLDPIALRVAQALNSGDSASATSAAEEYLTQHIEDDVSSNFDPEDSVESFWENAQENLEVMIFDGLAKIVPDASWNEDEQQELVTTFLASLQGKTKSMVIDQVEDSMRDSHAYRRNPHGYYGVKPEDF